MTWWIVDIILPEFRHMKSEILGNIPNSAKNVTFFPAVGRVGAHVDRTLRPVDTRLPGACDIE